MLEIVIEGLNMKAVNSLIWASAILVKLSVVIVGITAIITIGAILFDLWEQRKDGE